MIAYTRSIFYDLLSRIDKMLVSLESRKVNNDNAHIGLFVFYNETITRLKNLKDGVIKKINDNTLFNELFSANNLAFYNDKNEDLLLIEEYRYRVILHYGDGDRYFNNLIKKIYKEINFSSDPPFITTISNSNDYYWAIPFDKIIAVPIGEENNLLNLPDIYHEIGHLVFKQYESYLKTVFFDTINKYYTEEILLAENQRKSENYIKLLKKSKTLWYTNWFEEFFCDLIAVFWVGPAYAWTNIKLSTISSRTNINGVYTISNTHPSDESRMVAIIEMLNKLGYQNEVKEVNNVWDKFLKIVDNQKPFDYKNYFPKILISQAVEIIYDFCEDNLFFSYTKQTVGNNKPISLYLNKAWDIAINNPTMFADSEKQLINEMSKEV